jgi:hypothetical protein
VAIGLGLWKHKRETEIFKLYKSLLHKPLAGIIEQAKAAGMDVNNAFKFSVVRNPWDRMVSRYYFDMQYVKEFYEKHNVDTFEKYVIYHYNNFQKNGCRKPLEIKPYTYYNNEYAVDFVIRQENYNEGFEYVCNKLGIMDYEIVRHDHNTTRTNKQYQEMYNPETRSMVEQLGSETISLFSYIF